MGRKLMVPLAALGALLATVVVASPASAAGTPPNIKLGRPFDGAHYNLDSPPQPAAYLCQDRDGDETVVSCVGTVPAGQPYDSSFGKHTFTVTATDVDGNVTTKTSTYWNMPQRTTCTATAIRIGSTSYGPANSPTGPCIGGFGQAFDITQKLGPTLPLLGPLATITIRGGQAHTGLVSDQTWAEVGQIDLALPVIGRHLTIIGARSWAATGLWDPDDPEALCGGRSWGDSTLAFTWDRPIPDGPFGPPLPDSLIDTPLTIPLGIGTLYLNQEVHQGLTTTERAVFLDLPGTSSDVVIAESMAGNVCLA